MTSRAKVEEDTKPVKHIMQSMRAFYGASQETPLTDFSIKSIAGGLFLATTTLLHIDDSLTLQFNLHDHEKIVYCKAKVTWFNATTRPLKPNLPPGYGVQLIDLPPETTRLIRKVTAQNMFEPAW